MAIRRLTECHRSRHTPEHCGQIPTTLVIKYIISTYQGLAGSIHGHTARYTRNLEGSSWASSTDSGGRWHRCHTHCLHHLWLYFINGIASKKKIEVPSIWPTKPIYPVSSHLLQKKAPPKEGALSHIQALRTRRPERTEACLFYRIFE